MSSLLEYTELLESVKGKNAGNCKSCIFTSVQTDSRNVTAGTLFIPLVGEKQDGHIYIPQAIEKGASVVFINNSEFEKNAALYKELQEKNPDVLFVAVENTLHALQDAAECYATKVCKDMIRISITGSSGKTTTKEMMVAVCKAHFGDDGVAYTKGNFNSETGLPLTVFSIRGNEKVCVLEMGMNRVNEIGEISKVFKSQYGIITNIGTAHIGILGSRDNIAFEKKSACNYFDGNGKIFINADDDYAEYLSTDIKGSAVYYSEKMQGISKVEDCGLCGTTFYLEDKKINFPLYGKYNFYDALGVIVLAKVFNFSDEQIKTGIEKVKPLFGRAEVKNIKSENGKKYTVILDCYNANPDSMSESVDFFSKIKVAGKKYFVLGDMKELGDDSVKEHRLLGKKIDATDVSCAVLFGTEMAYAFSELQKVKAKYYENISDTYVQNACEFLNNVIDEGDLILIKGSRSMSLEQIANNLSGFGENK
jgi:UDP-N-acetylmuramoyl-tripeptide--D-alanyl-D-alanine ligase